MLNRLLADFYSRLIIIYSYLKAEILNSYFASVFTDENLSSFPLLASDVLVPKLEDIMISVSVVCDELKLTNLQV